MEDSLSTAGAGAAGHPEAENELLYALYQN